MNLIEAYRDAKRSHFSPYNDRKEFPVTSSAALHMARMAIRAEAIKAAWDAAGGELLAQYDATNEPGTVRIIELPDESASFDDLEGDTYNPKANPEIKAAILERERQAEIDRANRDGVWGYVAQHWNGSAWQDDDSIWGFIGDDFKGSGYMEDLMQSSLDGRQASLDAAARAMEAERPDMYGVAQ